jgi:hypothetical protein
MTFRHRGRNDLPLVVPPKGGVSLALDFLLAMLLRLPLPWPTDLSPTTVNDEGDCFLRSTIDLLLDRHRGVSS